MLVIVDYGMGNLASIGNMLKKAGHASLISSSPEDIGKATRLILPGVGAFDNGMQHLAQYGLLEPLHRKVIEERTPLLGICLGMQLLAQSSEEGKLPGLGWIEGEVVRFRQAGLKVPHMGWNEAGFRKESPLAEAMPEDSRFYFVHSYYFRPRHNSDILASTHYGSEFTSMVQRHNITGVQFHPEKSHKFGMQLLKNFVERC
jgi:imidazole glycerol-phosphate synthase subunit HisH